MNLSKNFTLAELSSTTCGLPNKPCADEIENLSLLCQKILQPLREAWGGPIVVNSGYRSTAVNKKIGGVKNSQHLFGQAADIKAPPPSPPPYGRGDGSNAMREANKRLFQLVIDLGLPFDQLIDEKDYSWIHVSYSPRHRRQVLHLK